MTREQGTAPTSASHLKIVGTAYGFNTAFPPGHLLQTCQCSEHIRLFFTGTNLAGPPLFTFFTHMLCSVQLWIFHRIWKVQMDIACIETLMSSRQLSSDKKSRTCVITFYKSIQIAVTTIQYLYLLMKR